MSPQSPSAGWTFFCLCACLCLLASPHNDQSQECIDKLLCIYSYRLLVRTIRQPHPIAQPFHPKDASLFSLSPALIFSCIWRLDASCSQSFANSPSAMLPTARCTPRPLPSHPSNSSHLSMAVRQRWFDPQLAHLAQFRHFPPNCLGRLHTVDCGY